MVARKKMRGAISMHTPRTLWRVSQSTRNQHAINTQSTRNQHAIDTQSTHKQRNQGAVSAHPNGESSTAARNQHAINMQSAQSARTQMVSPRPQLDGLAVAEAPVGERALC